MTYVKGSLQPYVAESSEEFQTIAQFETRGWTIHEFVVFGGWVCKGANSETVFDEVDLADDDWADYDDAAVSY